MEKESFHLNINFDKDQDVEDPLEILKLRKDNAHIFQLPPMTSSEGHVANDFQDLVFKGKMKVTVKGDYCLIYFLNADNTIFLVSIIDENIDKFVIRVKDSTRYFSIKSINNKGVATWVGLGNINSKLAFKQRNDAFDFYTTLTEFKEKLQFEKNLKNQEYQPKYDFSLKNEEKHEEKKPNNLNK
jgi:hypothetical protein